MVQAHIIYSGHVQGVGFRYSTVGYARQLGLVGRVRNLESGDVEIIAAGEEETIRQLCAKLDIHFDGHIHDKHISFEPVDKPRFHSFEVAF